MEEKATKGCGQVSASLIRSVSFLPWQPAQWGLLQRDRNHIIRLLEQNQRWDENLEVVLSKLLSTGLANLLLNLVLDMQSM